MNASLSDHMDGLESYAQFGEDRFLYEIFRDHLHGYCVEVGGYDGITGSATYLFEKRLNWTCLLVEPIPEYVKQIKMNRKCLVQNYAASSEEGEAVFHVANGVEQMSTLDLTRSHRNWIVQVGGAITQIKVRKKTLDQILEESGFQEIQFIVIDVEGHELNVLQGFSVEKYKPRIVIIEDNSHQIDRTIPSYMEEKGYVNFRRTGVNDWYAARHDMGLVDEREVQRLRRERRLARVIIPVQNALDPIKLYLPSPVKRVAKSLIHYLFGRTKKGQQGQ